MDMLRGEEGAALVTALMLTMLSLIIAMALLSTVIMGTRISASQKRYRTALAAAQGGVELLTREIIPRLFQVDATQDTVQEDFGEMDLKLPQYDCLKQKLTQPTANWSACNNPEQSSSDPANSPDVTFKLRSVGKNGFTVSTKIVDTIPGNSDKNSSIDYLDQGSSVSGKDEGIRPQHVPGIYNLSVQGEMEGGLAQEKARLSVLYAY
ncbi:MAG: pilus assembly protein PilX [Geobacteraceae bacterium GWC2_58_44]|nr:MAG: pilus assembly protein PilX [Geobacteraceae bacterium GWC2_58_44]HBG08256.1 pilus assembly protein PilX [Geobacter sp.]